MHATRMDEPRYREAEQALWRGHGIDVAEHWVDVPDLGGRVRVLEHGEGRPVLFVHGMPTAGGVWAPLVAHLSGVRALVVDRPGCALSDPLRLDGMTPARLREVNAAWMGAVLSERVGEAADVVGNSAGGMAAIMFAAARPGAVRSLVLDGVPAVSGMQLPLAMRAATLQPVARAVVRHRLTLNDLRRSFRSMGHADIIDTGTLPQEDLDWRVALAGCTDTYAHELALLRHAASPRGPRPEWVPGPAEVGALGAPSLWLVGDRDPFGDPWRVRRWARRAPDSQFRVLENSGHQPWLDDLEGHAALLNEYWARVGESARAS